MFFSRNDILALSFLKFWNQQILIRMFVRQQVVAILPNNPDPTSTWSLKIILKGANLERDISFLQFIMTTKTHSKRTVTWQLTVGKLNCSSEKTRRFRWIFKPKWVLNEKRLHQLTEQEHYKLSHGNWGKGIQTRYLFISFY